MRTLLAQRALSSLAEEDISKIAKTLFRAYWVEGRDVTDPGVITEITGSNSVEKAGWPEIKKSLVDASEEAVQ